LRQFPKTNVQDGNPNPEDGTGVFDIRYVEGVGVSPLTDNQINSQTSNLYFWVRLANITQDATVSAGDIDFVGTLPDLNNVKNLDAQSITTDLITEKTTDAGVTIDTWLLKDGVLVAEEIGTPDTRPPISGDSILNRMEPISLMMQGRNTSLPQARLCPLSPQPLEKQ
jgi:hypothetical protein